MHPRYVAPINPHSYSSLILGSGAIFGTGTNGAYVEKVENITKLGDVPVRHNGGDMVINTEWGGFNNTVSYS
jgi:hexokinase